MVRVYDRFTYIETKLAIETLAIQLYEHENVDTLTLPPWTKLSDQDREPYRMMALNIIG